MYNFVVAVNEGWVGKFVLKNRGLAYRYSRMYHRKGIIFLGGMMVGENNEYTECQRNHWNRGLNSREELLRKNNTHLYSLSIFPEMTRIIKFKWDTV